MNSYINRSTDESDDSTNIERSLQDTISVTTVPPAGKTLETKQAAADEDSTMSRPDKTSEPIPDPLKWFGILTPPTLRASQSSFKHTVTETTPLLANLSNEMKSIEIEVRRMRKKIKKLD